MTNTISIGPALGLKDGRIPDGVIRASSHFDENHRERQCRLDSVPTTGQSGAWCSLKLDTNQWIQVTFWQPTVITAVAIQGRQDCDQWITRYEILYNLDGSDNTFVRHQPEFTGNYDRNTVIINPLNIVAKTVRLRPLAWHGHISMRWELYGQY
jgi:hypothetical protein